MAPIIFSAAQLYLTYSLTLLFDTLFYQAQIEPQGSFPKVLAYYTLCTLINDTNADVRAKKAWVHLDIGQYQEALKWINLALEQEEHNDKFHRQKGLLLWEIQGTDAALQYVSGTIKLHPESKRLHKLLKRILIDKKHMIGEDKGIIQEYIYNITSWLQDLGGSLNGIDIMYNGDNFSGVTANRRIRDFTNILSVPLSTCIYEGMQYTSQEVTMLAKAENIEIKIILAFVMVIEYHNPGSVYKPYLDAVFASQPPPPLYYSQMELSMLSGSLALENIVNEIFKIENAYTDISLQFPSLAKYTFQEIKKAYAHILSYSTTLLIKKQTKVILIPFLNAFQPGLGEEKTKLFYDKGTLSINLNIEKTFNKGDEIRYFRKGYTNTEVFQMTGYVLEGDDSVQMRIQVGLNEHDPEASKKEEALKRHFQFGDISKTFLLEVPYKRSSLEANKFLSFFRVRELRLQNKDDSHSVFDSLQKNNGVIEPVTRESEIKAMDCLYYYISLRLRSYPTTIQEDLEELRNSATTYNEMNIIKMRYYEKRLLTDYLEYSETVVNALEMSVDEAMELVERKSRKVFYHKLKETFDRMIKHKHN